MPISAAVQGFARGRWIKWLNRRIPPTQDIVLNQRRVFIFLSSHGGLMSCLLLSLFIAGINYANNLLLGLCFFLSSLLVITMHHTFANLSGLRITTVTTQAAFAGEVAGFTIRLSNPNGRTYYNLLLEWADASERVAVLEQGQEVTLFLRSQQRGRFYPPRLKIVTTYPLGLLRAWTWLALDMNAIIYPQPMPYDELPAGAGDKDDTEHGHKRRVGIEDFEGLKSFHAGDPLAHVSWKHLARGQGMLVKTYSEPVTGSNCLDYQAFVGLDKETRLQHLTWWVLRLTQNQQPFALKLPHKTISVGSGHSHQTACLTALALFEETQ
ncbi:DUF58 domain-containing protein [Agitococcus lubricus]|uniref:Uncharacterized protein (DUF58 family) n=1 Tax=Agitococcus lubricus TaxID=1077255 RepID=A0A2T5IWZ7_9GAMM|nr:DUF58 domain-containing protein [Agitococcus lubricus]PTQ88458.1 uncharacterized protein (DUF58 family) [Agitococcus lubricus]